jgi:DNA-binding transcriptional LysR family regulator
MQIKYLECFMLISELKSFTKAAQMLFLSPPAVTQQINALEDQLGFKLFNRSNKGVSLTDAGRNFYDDAKQIVEFSNKAIQKGRAIAEKNTDSIAIGVSGPVCTSLLPAICHDFYERHHDATVKFVDDPTNSFEQVLQGKNDVNITFGNKGLQTDGIRNTLLCMDDPVCLISLDHPYAVRASVRVEDFSDMNFVLTAPGISAYHDTLHAAIASDHPQVRTMYVDRHDCGLMQMDAEKAVALVPGLFGLENEHFVTIPFEGLPQISIDLFTKENCDSTVQKFIDSAKDTVRSLKKNAAHSC